ncbi:MAG TPA: hypothetical protein VGN00_09380 [Puia sp.]|jgi:hypothetical protein
MKPYQKAILFFAAIFAVAALLTSCKAPLGCQDTYEMSGYVPHQGHTKTHMTHRKSY